MVYKKYAGSGKFDSQQLVIMDKKEKANELSKKESDKKKAVKTKKTDKEVSSDE